MPDDQSWQFLDDLVEMNITSSTSAASASDIMHALSVADLSAFIRLVNELVEEGFLIRRPPRSIRETVAFYVDNNRYDRAIAAMDPDYVPPDPTPTDWEKVKEGVQTLAVSLDEDTLLSQSDRAQAGALIASLKILVESPNPPPNAIRNLLYDLAALATLFALAMQIASMVK